MTKFSLKTLQAQLQRASDFYGKPDVSPTEFFRFVKSPFLAKALIDIACKDSLFERITEDLASAKASIESESAIPKLGEHIRFLDSKVARILLLCRLSLGAIYLFVVIFVSCTASDATALSKPLERVVILLLVTGFVSVLVLNSLARRLSLWLLSRTSAYREVLKYLKRQFALYKSTIEHWESLSWQSFEREVAQRLESFGYAAHNTKLSGDQGVDVVVTKGDRIFVIQCKVTKNKLGPAYVRDFVGTVRIQNAVGGMLISKTGFTNGALEAHAYKNVFLVSTEEFVLLNRSDLESLIGW